MKGLLAVLLLLVASAYPQAGLSSGDARVISKIREEGFQRSQVMDMAGYMAVFAYQASMSDERMPRKTNR